MSAFTFKKATKLQAKLRAAVFGPSGAGKTYTCLRLATGISRQLQKQGKPHMIAVIDTERGSASKYSDRFDFNVLDLPDKRISTYVAAIRAAAADHGVLVIDSLSHAWQDLLQEVEAIAKAKYRGNTWSAWNEGTPKQRSLVDAILDFPGHILVTMRSKTEWSEEKDERTGKVKPVRVGMAPEQGKGIEYEFDMLLELNVDHYCNVIKDRSGKFQDAIIQKPGEDFGAELLAWLQEGGMPQRDAAAQAPAQAPAPSPAPASGAPAPQPAPAPAAPAPAAPPAETAEDQHAAYDALRQWVIQAIEQAFNQPAHDQEIEKLANEPKLGGPWDRNTAGKNLKLLERLKSKNAEELKALLAPYITIIPF